MRDDANKQIDKTAIGSKIQAAHSDASESLLIGSNAWTPAKKDKMFGDFATFRPVSAAQFASNATEQTTPVLSQQVVKASARERSVLDDSTMILASERTLGLTGNQVGRDSLASALSLSQANVVEPATVGRPTSMDSLPHFDAQASHATIETTKPSFSGAESHTKQIEGSSRIDIQASHAATETTKPWSSDTDSLVKSTGSPSRSDGKASLANENTTKMSSAPEDGSSKNWNMSKADPTGVGSTTKTFASGEGVASASLSQTESSIGVARNSAGSQSQAQTSDSGPDAIGQSSAKFTAQSDPVSSFRNSPSAGLGDGPSLGGIGGNTVNSMGADNAGALNSPKVEISGTSAKADFSSSATGRDLINTTTKQGGEVGLGGRQTAQASNDLSSSAGRVEIGSSTNKSDPGSSMGRVDAGSPAKNFDPGSLAGRVDAGSPAQHFDPNSPAGKVDVGSPTKSLDPGSSTGQPGTGSSPRNGDAGSPTSRGDTGSPTKNGDLGTSAGQAGTVSSPRNGDAGSTTNRSDTGSPTRTGETGSTERKADTGSPTRTADAGSAANKGDTGSPTRTGDTGSTTNRGDSGSVTTKGDTNSPINRNDSVSVPSKTEVVAPERRVESQPALAKATVSDSGQSPVVRSETKSQIEALVAGRTDAARVDAVTAKTQSPMTAGKGDAANPELGTVASRNAQSARLDAVGVTGLPGSRTENLAKSDTLTALIGGLTVEARAASLAISGTATNAALNAVRADVLAGAATAAVKADAAFGTVSAAAAGAATLAAAAQKADQGRADLSAPGKADAAATAVRTELAGSTAVQISNGALFVNGQTARVGAESTNKSGDAVSIDGTRNGIKPTDAALTGMTATGNRTLIGPVSAQVIGTRIGGDVLVGSNGLKSLVRAEVPGSSDKRYITGVELAVIGALVAVAKSRSDAGSLATAAKAQNGGAVFRVNDERLRVLLAATFASSRLSARALTLSAILAIASAANDRGDSLTGAQARAGLRIERTLELSPRRREELAAGLLPMSDRRNEQMKDKIQSNALAHDAFAPNDTPMTANDLAASVAQQVANADLTTFSFLKLHKNADQELDLNLGEIKDGDDQTTEEDAKTNVLYRPTWLIGKGESLVSIAEMFYQDANLGWLIADLNKDKLTERWIDNKRVVEVHSRERLELPVLLDIEEFYDRRPCEADPDNLVTIVVETQIDKDLVNFQLGTVMSVTGGNSAW